MRKIKILAARNTKTAKQLETALNKGISELPEARAVLEKKLEAVNRIYEKINALYADIRAELKDVELRDCYYDYDINVAADQVSDLDNLSDKEYEALDALYSKFDDEAVKYDEMASQLEAVEDDLRNHRTSTRDF